MKIMILDGFATFIFMLIIASHHKYPSIEVSILTFFYRGHLAVVHENRSSAAASARAPSPTSWKPDISNISIEGH
jgi:hypothetical protein